MSLSSSLTKLPIWWDRESDSTGKQIRKDVRDAAHMIWERALLQVKRNLGDPGEAAGLMETSVSQVSRYLDRKNAPANAKDTAAILMVALGRNLRRYAAKMKRIELLADLSELGDPASHNACSPTKTDCQIDAEKVARKLNPRSRVMLHLRTVGFDWKELRQPSKLPIAPHEQSSHGRSGGLEPTLRQDARVRTAKRATILPIRHESPRSAGRPELGLRLAQQDQFLCADSGSSAGL